MKIQIIDEKVCFRQNIAGRFQQNFENEKIVDITQQCFALLPQVNFSANNLNFHLKAKVMGSNLGYLLKSFLLYVGVLNIKVYQ